MREKMSKQPPPAPIASAVGPCPTLDTPALEVYQAPSHHPTTPKIGGKSLKCTYTTWDEFCNALALTRLVILNVFTTPEERKFLQVNDSSISSTSLFE